MKNQYSRNTLVVTALISALAALVFACRFDLSPKSQAENNSIPQPILSNSSNSSKAVTAGLPALTGLVKQVKPAVVNISTTKHIKVRPLFRGDPFNDFFGRNYGAPQEYSQSSLGSGFIINKDGTILTNNHVIQGADEIIVKLSDGRKFNAKVVGNDPKTDIAVIRIDAAGDFPFVSLGNSDTLEVGEWVLAVGNPFGLGQTVTTGIVSAKGRVIGAGPYDDFIQTDASINPGNSGGPLFNLNGEVIGINTAIVASGQGIGFAIPITMAKNYVPQLIQKGRVSRGYLGVGIQEITPELAKSFGLNTDKGALIANVYPGGPAEKAGIEAGDLVVALNGKNIESSHDLPLLISQTPVGSQVSVDLIRKGNKKTVSVQVGELEKAEQEITQAKKVSNELGLGVRDVGAEEAAALGLKEAKGVLVVRVAPQSQAEYVGIQSGDLILGINDLKVNNLAEYTQALSKIQTGSILRVFVKRGNATSFFAFKK